MRTLLCAALMLILTVFSSDANGQTQPMEPQYIYVCNQGSATLTVINAETNEITETIDLQELGYSENAKPHFAIAEPDGSFWYVTLIGENTVLKFNRDNELVGSVDLEVPGLMALHPDKDELYVGRSMSAVNPPQSFGTVKRSDMSLISETDLFFGRPHAIANIPGKDQVFIASLSSNQFLTIDTETEEQELINLDGTNNVFVNFAISPDGNTMVGTGQVTGKLLIFDVSEPGSPELRNTIDVNAQPWHPVYSPDGKYVYFANKGANTVTVVDMETEQVDAVITGEGLAQPHGATLSVDGKYLYVSNNNMIMKGMGMNMNEEMDHSSHSEPGNGTVVIIDTEKHEIIKVIEVGINATGIGTNAR
jgi:YVTN family beta-propeller protein